jgi:hypothetical protein
MDTPENQGNKLKVFFRDARVLSKAEIEELPQEKRREVEESGDQGVWLEVNTPTATITERKNRLCVQLEEDDAQDKGMWLDFFCPDERCYRPDSMEML